MSFQRFCVETMLLMATCACAVTQAAAQTIAVSGDPGPVTVQTATAGSQPDPVSESTTTYSVTTTAPNQKIVARLESPMPNGVTLAVQLVAPPGASSLGAVTLTTTDQDVVGPIASPESAAGLTVKYVLSATVSAGPVATSTRTVIFSIVAGP